MNLNTLKQIIRHLIRRRYYSGISILSLGIGLGCAILMATYIIHEFSFDSYHRNSARIYRLIDGDKTGTPYAMGEAFEKEVPEIEKICRVYTALKIKVKPENEFFDEDKIVLADNSIYDFFDVQIINGNEKLSEPNSIMISQRLAKKYFSDNNPIDKYLETVIGGKNFNLKITGVFKNFPSNSSLQTNIIGNINIAFKLLWDIEYSIGFSDKKPDIDYNNVWIRNEFTTFLLLKEKVEKLDVERKCTQLCLKHREENPTKGITLQSMSQMYLHSGNLELTNSFAINQLSSLKIFTGIGLLILLIAIINFILISNADTNNSIQEIACRKVNGAKRSQIIFESLFKSVMVAFISLIPAIILVWISIPIFNSLFQKELSIGLLFKWQYILALVLITLMAGISAGLYLGLFISRVSPGKLFNNNYLPFKRRGILKGFLVTIQFVVFILLTICFLTMQKQYKYSLNKDIGLNPKNILVIKLQNDEMIEKAEFIKNKIIANSNVVNCIPGSFMVPPVESILMFSYKGEDGKPKNQIALVFGPGLIEMTGIKLLEGRTFNANDESFGGKFIINKAASEKFKVGAGGKIDQFNIIGVVDNFHFQSLHSSVEPVFIAVQTTRFPCLLIKTNGNNKDVIEFTQEVFNEISPGYLMEFELLEDRITKFYSKEEKQIGTIGFFSAVAMALSIMGLLGFVALNMVKRTKEIGIRKINGANTFKIIGMMCREYIAWISIAFVIASPIAWYAMHKWLENFAYKTTLSWWIFAVAGLMALGIALLTVSLQTWRAARQNPVESLRYE
jgi:putative ABC transport system permease protein